MATLPVRAIGLLFRESGRFRGRWQDRRVPDGVRDHQPVRIRREAGTPVAMMWWRSRVRAAHQGQLTGPNRCLKRAKTAGLPTCGVASSTSVY